MQPTSAPSGGPFDLDAAIRLAGLDSFADHEPSKDDIATVFCGMGIGQYAGLDEQPAHGPMNLDHSYVTASPLEGIDPQAAQAIELGEQNSQPATGDGSGHDDGNRATEQPAVAVPTIASRSVQQSQPDWDELWTSRQRDPVLDKIMGEDVSSSPIPPPSTAPPAAPLPPPHHSDGSAPPLPASSRDAGTRTSGSVVQDMGLSEATSPASSASQTPSLVQSAASSGECTSTDSPSTPTDDAAAVNAHDDGANALVGRVHDHASPNRSDKINDEEARALAARLAALYHIPLETLLVATPQPQPATPAPAKSPLRKKSANKTKSVVPPPRSSATALDDACLAQFCAGMSNESRQEAERIAAEAGRPGNTALNAMIGSRPMEGMVANRLFKRGWDEGMAHAMNKRAKRSDIRQQEEEHIAAHRSVATLSPFAVDDTRYLNNNDATLHDIKDMVPSGQMESDAALSDDDWDDEDAETRRMDSAPQGPSSNEGEHDDEVIEQQQGAMQLSAPAPAGLGQPAQTNNKVKTSLGKAIEKNAQNRERLFVEAEIALRIIERPQEPLQVALPLTVASWFKEDLRVLMGLPSKPASPTDPADSPKVCNACFEAGHHNCGNEATDACCVCGCPIARVDDYTQCHKHRLRKCPGWCVRVSTGRHEEWLAQNGLLEKLGEEHGERFKMQKQFFGEHMRKEADAAAAADKTGDKDGARRKALLKALNWAELDSLRGGMASGNPFASILSLKRDAVVERLRAKVRAEASSSATTIDA